MSVSSAKHPPNTRLINLLYAELSLTANSELNHPAMREKKAFNLSMNLVWFLFIFFIVKLDVFVVNIMFIAVVCFVVLSLVRISRFP